MITARVEIDRSALRSNYIQLKQITPKNKTIAVLKGNAYGHGAVTVAQMLPEADAFAVARIEEAIELRHAKITNPIILLEGCFCASDLQEAARLDLQTVIHDSEQLQTLKSTLLPKKIAVWLKIDTGMHRLGIYPEDVAQYVFELTQTEKLKGNVNFMSHFYMADKIDSPITLQQLELFVNSTKNYPGYKSISNSAGLLYWPASRLDWNRAGIALYGVSPIEGKTCKTENLQPVMSLKSSIISIRELEAGETIGYGGTGFIHKNTKIGVVALGYGDGYPQCAPNGTPVFVNGRIVPLIGKVSMDMITIDLGLNSTDQVGDEVQFWGKDLPIEKIAEYSNVITYELLIKITNRVRRILIE